MHLHTASTTSFLSPFGFFWFSRACGRGGVCWRTEVQPSPDGRAAGESRRPFFLCCRRRRPRTAPGGENPPV